MGVYDLIEEFDIPTRRHRPALFPWRLAALSYGLSVAVHTGLVTWLLMTPVPESSAWAAQSASAPAGRPKPVKITLMMTMTNFATDRAQSLPTNRNTQPSDTPASAKSQQPTEPVETDTKAKPETDPATNEKTQPVPDRLALAQPPEPPKPIELRPQTPPTQPPQPEPIETPAEPQPKDEPAKATQPTADDPPKPDTTDTTDTAQAQAEQDPETSTEPDPSEKVAANEPEPNPVDSDQTSQDQREPEETDKPTQSQQADTDEPLPPEQPASPPAGKPVEQAENPDADSNNDQAVDTEQAEDAVPSAIPDENAVDQRIAFDKMVRPKPSAKSRRLKETGTVVIQIDVDEKGKLLDYTVIDDAGKPRLRKAAVDALRASTFLPAKIDDKPVRSTRRVEYRF